ncbi:MAG: OmpA family protein [Bacteroidota bacterium]
MKTPVPLLILVWMVWVGFCSYLNQNMCCNGGNNTALSIVDANNTLVAQAEEGIKFNAADKLAIIPAIAQTELEKLVRYMEKHPAKVLILTGGFTADETTQSNEQYLGLERAESFREHLVDMGIAARQIAIMERPQNELYEKDGFVYGALDYTFKNRFLTIEDNTGSQAWRIHVKDNLVFSFSDFTTQVSPNVQDALEKLANYLQSHPDRILQINGLYSSKENYEGIYNNLGLARANAVKNVLQELNVPTKQLRVMGAQDSELDMFDSAVIGGVSFNFLTTSATEEEKTVQELERELKAEDINIYFETGKDDIKWTPELKKYFTSLSHYFDLNEEASIKVVGHTDNKGSSTDNLKLGDRRARDIRDYLVKNGIPKARIEVSSRGDRDPIQSNRTKEGRAANRRVEVKVK